MSDEHEPGMCEHCGDPIHYDDGREAGELELHWKCEADRARARIAHVAGLEQRIAALESALREAQRQHCTCCYQRQGSRTLGPGCDCGADAHNARIAAALAQPVGGGR